MTEIAHVQDKTYLAYNLKLAGLSLPEIADRLEYSSPGAVALDIRHHIQDEAKRQTHEFRESLLVMELDRLDYMQSRIWPQVEHGDIKAVETALKIIQTRTKLAGLDAIDASSNTQTVLVVGGAEGEYINQLKAAAGIEQ